MSRRFPLTLVFGSPAFRLVALALLAILVLPAAAQSPRDGQRAERARPGAAAQVARLTDGLALTTDQQQRLAAVTARHDASAPGASWRLAAEVARVLTPAQTAQLQAATAARRAERGDRMRARTADGQTRRATRRATRPQGERRRADRAARPDRAARMPDAQRAALRDAQEAFQPQMEALTERFRRGALDAAAFAAERERLSAERRARVEAALTPEQREARAAMEARRAAEQAARVEALGLTPQQQAQMEALALERLRTAPARGARSDADRAARRAQAEQMQERAASILTAEQQAITAIHRALGGDRMGHRRGMGRGEGRRQTPARDRAVDR